MSLNSDDMPTGPIAGGWAQQAPPAPAREPMPDSVRRQNIIRDVTAGVLVVIALLFPWNLYFGFRIPGSNRWIWLALLLVTLLSLASLVVSRVRFDRVMAGRLRTALNIPYLLLVLAFVGYDAFQTIRSGGTVHVPGGVGPGGWLGIAGSLLSAQPVITGPAADDDRYYRKWLRTARILGYASMFGAALSSGFNLCWRVRFALQGSDGGPVEFGTQNITVLLAAVVYGVVALAAVLVASRWILRGDKPSRLATFALGLSTLVAGIIVWSLPIGREIDAFHGIAQNTSTAGVGYEGYLAWAAAAALFAPLTVFSSPNARTDKDVWHSAMRKGLLLITVWAFSSVLMRITDLVVAVILNYPYSRYDTMTLAAFDLGTAVLALWLLFNAANAALRPRLIASLCGFLFSLTVCRVILGIALAPRFEKSPNVFSNPVYGNNLAQQITSTFDVVLCGLALCILVAAIITGRLRRPRRAPRHPRRPRAAAPRPSDAKTTQFGVVNAVDDDAPTSDLSRPAPSPRIFRSSETTQQLRPKIFRPPGSS
ncbi:hypothetical protein MSIMFI_00456 [Mycobacterium simulans]|nr:hypothetical protein MSIMFI_00456 [Mycobacterium simulans]